MHDTLYLAGTGVFAQIGVLASGSSNITWLRPMTYTGNIIIRTITFMDNLLYIGGSSLNGFAPYNSNLVSYDMSSGVWKDIRYIYGIVEALAVDSNNLYVMGGFQTVANIGTGSLTVNGIARWNAVAAQWSPLGDGVRLNASSPAKRVLVIDGGYLYVISAYRAGTTDVNLIARWSIAEQTWSSLGSGIWSGTTANVGDIYSMTVSNGAIYVAGFFNLAGDQPAKNVAVWHSSCSAATTQIAPTVAQCTPASKAWTLMIYMSSDNDIDTLGSYQIYDTISRTVAYNPAVRVLLLWDRSENGDTRRYAFDGGQRQDWPMGELAMDDPVTLTTFVTWARTTYPSQHYALIMDGHGSGLGGLMYDSHSGDLGKGHSMSIKQWGAALRAATNNGAQPLDVLYMHACQMGMIEDAYEVRGLTSYYVASEATAWGPYTAAAYYDILGATATTTPFDLAKRFADDYAGVVSRDGRPYTVSVANMAQIDSVNTAIGTFGQRLSREGVSLAAIRRVVQRFDEDGDDLLETTDRYADFYHLAQLFRDSSSDTLDQQAAQQVMNAILNNYIVVNHTGSGYVGPTVKGGNPTAYIDNQHSHGVSIFFPERSSSFYTEQNYAFAEGATWPKHSATALPAQATPSWGATLAAIIQATNPDAPDDPDPPTPLAPLEAQMRVYLPVVQR